MTKRKKKVIDREELSSYLQQQVHHGIALCVGGLLKQNRPVALIRELIRQEIKDIRLFSSPATGYDVDLMVAAGMISELFIPGVTLESRLCPSYRAAVEKGEVISHGVDALTIAGGLMAGAEGIPFHPVAAWKGSDLLEVNPLIKEMVSPFNGEKLYAVQTISPDVALIHAQEADEYGNIRHLSTMTYADNLIARASKKVIVSVDRIVPNEWILRHPKETTIPCNYVDVVVELPYGAHPTGSFPLYSIDDQHIEYYADIAERARLGDGQALIDYFEQYIFQPRSHVAYLKQIGYEQLFKLEREARFI